MTIFICLFIVSYNDFIKTYQEYSQIEWDIKTVTAGDYTIEFQITEKMYENFKRDYYVDKKESPKIEKKATMYRHQHQLSQSRIR
jgi:hypothetical protein